MEIDVGGIVFGDENLCPIYGGRFDGARIHAAKDKCHRVACNGYTKIAASDPEYLTARRGSDLYLNIVDAPVTIFRAELFIAALDFIDDAVAAGQLVAIHCNQGHSRAPSIALLWKAKRQKTIPDDDYATARNVFEIIVGPDIYAPGRGIETFLGSHWTEIR